MTTTGVGSAQLVPLESPAFEVLKLQIRSKLSRGTNDRSLILMTCGIAGSGKSTLAKTVIAKLPNFVRLSGDKWVRDKYGLYGIDFPREKYGDYLDEAQAQIKLDLVALIKEGTKDAVLDLSFWNKEYRDEYKKIIEDAGGQWVLVFLDGEKDLLWSRIQGRRAARDKIPVESGARDGDSAYDIEPETFEMYWGGFEPPTGEGEVRVPVT